MVVVNFYLQIKSVPAVDLKPDFSDPPATQDTEHKRRNAGNMKLKTKDEAVDENQESCAHKYNGTSTFVDGSSTDDNRSETTDSDAESNPLLLPKITNVYSLRSEKKQKQAILLKNEKVNKNEVPIKSVKLSSAGESHGSPSVVLVDIGPFLASVRMQRITDHETRSTLPFMVNKLDVGCGGEGQETKKAVRRSLRLSKIGPQIQKNETDHCNMDREASNYYPIEGSLKDAKIESVAARYFKKMTEKHKETSMECSLCGFTSNCDGNATNEPLLLHLRSQHNVMESKTNINVTEIDMNIAEMEKRSGKRGKNRSIAWDFFTKRWDRFGNEMHFCVLCDYQCTPTGKSSTGSMLHHLHNIHNHTRLPLKCRCTPPCEKYKM